MFANGKPRSTYSQWSARAKPRGTATNGQTNERTDGRSDEQASNGRTDGRSVGLTDAQLDGRKHNRSGNSINGIEGPTFAAEYIKKQTSFPELPGFYWQVFEHLSKGACVAKVAMPVKQQQSKPESNPSEAAAGTTNSDANVGTFPFLESYIP